MNRCALFADVSNLYYCVGRKFEGRKLDYEKLLAAANEIGTVLRAFAYGSQRWDEAVGFIAYLRKIGYEPRYKEAPSVMDGEKRSIRKADWEVGIAVEVFRQIDRTDTVILCSANAIFAPLVDWVRDRGVRVIVLGCGITRELKELADEWIEIGEDLMEVPANAA